MAVTKQTYTISPNFTPINVADTLRTALIDAGLMTEWYDAFNPSGTRIFRVLEIQYDSTKTFGKSFYVFCIETGSIGLQLATGTWSGNLPTGVQFLDWSSTPANTFTGSNYRVTDFFNWSTTSNLLLDRYTSQLDPKQNWFIFRQGVGPTRSAPFSFLHKDTSLHSWLDLDKGCISGFSRINCAVSARTGLTSFCIEENLRRCLGFGPALRGNTDPNFGNQDFHNIGVPMHSYLGTGMQSSNDNLNNWPTGLIRGILAATPLPIGRNAANPAFTTDYVPICTNLPWNYYTPTRLADDFGVYMHYSANDIVYNARFIVQSTINEWEVLNFANNANVTDGASATFVARVI